MEEPQCCPPPEISWWCPVRGLIRLGVWELPIFCLARRRPFLLGWAHLAGRRPL